MSTNVTFTYANQTVNQLGYVSGPLSFTFYRAQRRVTAHYTYVMDADFGHEFIKLCAHFPPPGKVWVNGREWAKR